MQSKSGIPRLTWNGRWRPPGLHSRRLTMEGRYIEMEPMKQPPSRLSPQETWNKILDEIEREPQSKTLARILLSLGMDPKKLMKETSSMLPENETSTEELDKALEILEGMDHKTIHTSWNKK